ncbi:MAG TPA: PfkB family carbohydrate kinase [Tepidisphaeraceae bacterium]|nr:PfkB family carbohydrate kinase [Tepidisphaeraceae bacterium]
MTSTRKIVSREQLLALRERARGEGASVVHCHGCFDIVHPGHIHHLQFAKSMGDLLVVSVSADPHVNKGLDRPLIPDELRAQSLAALECVDAVYVNPHPTAVELLAELRPDVYVKGREYEQNVEPRFVAEKETVVRHGGRVVFSSGDVVFSSTELIGTLTRPERFHAEKVSRLREEYGLTTSHLSGLLHRGRGRRIVVIGDYILDRYHFCDATGVAGEGPMLSLRPMQQRDYDGGAGVIALHLAAMGARPTLIGALADDELSAQISMRLESRGVDVQCHGGRREVVCKHRYLVDHSKLFKVDDGSPSPGDSQLEGLLAAKIIAACEGADAAIIVDFGYGMITAGLLARILPELRKRVEIISGDVSGQQSQLLNFRGVDLLCPTEREIRETLHDFSSGLGAVAWRMLNETQARNAIVTLGKQGMVSFDGNQRPLPARLASEYVPALAGHAIDPLGCGDALLSAATLALVGGGSLAAAAFLGAVAAAVEAQEIGNQPVSAEQILSQLYQRDALPAAARMAG